MRCVSLVPATSLNYGSTFGYILQHQSVAAARRNHFIVAECFHEDPIFDTTWDSSFAGTMFAVIALIVAGTALTRLLDRTVALTPRLPQRLLLLVSALYASFLTRSVSRLSCGPTSKLYKGYLQPLHRRE
jgi:hypothetical protein